MSRMHREIRLHFAHRRTYAEIRARGCCKEETHGAVIRRDRLGVCFVSVV